MQLKKVQNEEITKQILDFSRLLEESESWEKINQLNNNWVQEALWKNYHKLSNKKKGVVGEDYVKQFFLFCGHDVEKSANTDHDMIIDGHKVEVKFSLATSKEDKIKRNNFMVNHVARAKDWDRLLVVVINAENPENTETELDYEKSNFYWCTKKDFLNYMNTTSREECVFRHQQTGEKGKNDDYICTGKNLLKWIHMDWVKTLAEW